MSQPTDHRYIIIRELWNCNPELKQLLEDALYQAVIKFGGFEKIAREIDVPVEELVLCDWVNHIPDGYILKKLFPLMFPEIEEAIDRCMERRAIVKAQRLYDKYRLDEREDLGVALKDFIQELGNDFENNDNEAFVDFLCQFIELLNNDFDA
ncbi:hypothetical protein [Victivallis vadensis]|uniref:hypothetical protein n=1 Tax=Victivallis vadensis TaxID=172901 RepID=UPI003D07F762